MKERIAGGFMLVLMVIVLAFAGTLLFGQTTPTVRYDAAAGQTAAQNAAWTPILYVNNQPFVGTSPMCTSAPVVCSFPLPNIASALTPIGPQSFQIALRDPILGEGLKNTVPLVLTRPGTPTNLQVVP